MKRLLLIFSMLFIGATAPAAAQVTQADTAAVLLSVANRLRAEGRSQLANSLIDLILERYGSTPAGAEAERMRAQFRMTREEASGRTELLVFTTTYGMFLGSTLPIAMGADDAEAVGVGLIAGGPAGFLLGRQILRSRAVTEGQARAISFGTTWGLYQGWGWTYALDIGEEEFCPEPGICYTDDADGETLLRAALVGSAIGLGTGLYLSRKPIPAGTATTVSFGALWGTWFGFASSVLIDDDSGDEALTWALVGGNAGLLTTALLAPKWNLSRGRARLISISGVAGALAGAGLLMITQPDADNKAILVPMATSALGLALGVGWTRNYDERARPQGGGLDGALLQWNRGSFQAGIPTLGVRSLETRLSGRVTRTPAIQVPLFKATF